MIKLKREIQISVRRSDLPLLCKLSLTPKASLVMVTKVQMMEAIWFIRVIRTHNLAVLRVLCTIFKSLITINYLLVSLRHQAKMEVVAVETLLLMKWWCKEISRCCNNSSKSCFRHFSRFNYRISIFRTTPSLIHFLLIINLVTNSLAALIQVLSQLINKFPINSTTLLRETAGVRPPLIILSISSSINLFK